MTVTTTKNSARGVHKPLEQMHLNTILPKLPRKMTKSASETTTNLHHFGRSIIYSRNSGHSDTCFMHPVSFLS